MALLFSTTTTPSCASSTNTIPKLSVSKTMSNTLRKLKPYGLATVCFFQQNKPLVVCLSRFLARAYDDDGNGVEQSIEDTYDLPLDSESQDNSIEIEIEKTGKNSRRIRSKVAIRASLQTVWDILTDYERLADFIPGLAVSKLLDKRENFARLFQIGEQNLAFGLKFNAKGTIDCFEKDLQTLPFGQKRDIEFKMVEGDFQLFEGVWSIEQSDYVAAQDFEATLLYIVNVKPKVWLPVRLVEGRLCKEIRTNLSCIREEAEKTFRITPPAS
ncbi:hypothetical protein PHJA_002714000 [Phtheirospermum japonicum]|uniref:Coenzyme Q-binding protein COQ10 START domain-containing protein n=1 Tax=Phtheirospermum japonicum TaxID=374723 RepID=A0A830D7A8_9LAMI|nr:hypothetical protein PHJA_002714000 [Phtheirospermum japonicum]